MNWYTLVKYSQNWQAFAETLGVSNEEMSALETIDDDKTRSIVLNEKRKEPQASIQFIINNIKPKREVEHTHWEMSMANRFHAEELSKWILVQLRRLRKSPKEVMLKERGVRGPGEMVQDFDYQDTVQSLIGNTPTARIQELRDWYHAERPQMASYTLQQAIEAAKEWHDRVSSETEATEFKEGEKNIVYGPQWENPEWNGWTVRRILTANDVQYEGYVMEHCVGSYDCAVVDERTKIYSLRDPENKPHVTMDVAVKSWDFKQIYGKSNSEPKSEYKKMIKEWMKTLKGVTIGEIDGFDCSELQYKDDWDVPDALHNAIFRNNDYGIETNLTYFEFDEALNSVISALTGKRGSDYTYGADQIAETLVMATVEKDRGMIDYFFEEIEISRRKGESSGDAFELVDPSMRDFETNDLISFIETAFEELDENVFEASSQYGLSLENHYTAEEIESFEPEELERRKEAILDELEKDIRDEYVNENIKYALADALLKNLKGYLTKNPLPAHPWTNKIEGGPPKFTYYQEKPGVGSKQELSQGKAE
jgi:hypothetical protein